MKIQTYPPDFNMNFWNYGLKIQRYRKALQRGQCGQCSLTGIFVSPKARHRKLRQNKLLFIFFTRRYRTGRLYFAPAGAI